MSDLIKPNRNVIASGITNNGPRTPVHLLEYRGWIKKDDVQRPLQDGSNVVMGRLCAGSWQEAVPIIVERMKALCEKNQVAEDSFEISYVAIKEMDIPLS